eukprot:9262381-Karenia_brevis.AAC.1
MVSNELLTQRLESAVDRLVGSTSVVGQQPKPSVDVPTRSVGVRDVAPKAGSAANDAPVMITADNID